MANWPKKDKIKYVKAVNRIKSGLGDCALGRLRAIHLTTRAGDDNSKARMRKDIRKLNARFRRMTHGKVELSGSLGYTDKKYLIHFHGVVRFKDGGCPVNRRQLGDMWNEIHNAFVVKITRVKTHKELVKYIVQHIMKNYVEAGMNGNLIVASRGWTVPLPDGFEKEIKDWYLQATGYSWLDKIGWKILKGAVEAYRCKERKVFKCSEGQIYITEKGIQDKEIFEFEERTVENA